MRSRMCRVWSIVGFLTLLSITAPNGFADPIAFNHTFLTYTGNTFDIFNFFDPSLPVKYDTSMYVSATFDVGMFLGPDFSGRVLPWAYSVSDGINTIASDTPGSIILELTMSATGEVVLWGFGTPNVPGTAHAVIGSSKQTNLSLDNAVMYDSAQNFRQTTGRRNAPGTWSVTYSTTPEPDSLELIVVGLVMLGLCIRYRGLRRHSSY